MAAKPDSVTTEAETFIASQCITRPVDTVSRVKCKPQDFSSHRAGAVFETICGLVERGESEVDTVGLAELSGVDTGYINDLLEVSPNAYTPEIWSNHVREAASKRRLKEIFAMGMSDDSDPEEIAERVVSAISMATEDDRVVHGDASRVMLETVEHIENTYENKSAVGIETGIQSLQDSMGGLPKSVLTIIGAETSVGKTAFALDVLLAAGKAGHGGDYYTLEDEKRNIGRRLISKVSGVALQKLRTCMLTDQDFISISRGASAISALPVRIYDKSYLSAEKFVFDMRRNARQNRTEIIFVDYLQLLRLSDSKSNRNDEIDKILFLLKAAAKDLGCAIVLLSQLRRRDKDDDSKPTKNRLRDSGTIEQHSHVILMVHRKPMTRNALLLVEKNKDGPLGEIDMVFNSDTASYSERGSGE